MAFEYLAYNLSRDSTEINSLSVNRRALRNVDNPFDLDAYEFRKLYRLNLDIAENLVSELDGYLKGSRITAISSEKQVLTALRFYATGCFQRPIGEQWGISMSQPTISRCIHKVTDAINGYMFRPNIRFPMTQIERQAAKETFASASSSFVGGAIGAIDCTHISIMGPKNHEEAYVNHHGYHSINVQMICDPNLKILNVNARFPGARHDSFIWNSSAVRRVMKRSFETGNHNMFLLGDSGYPLEPWLMTPLPNQPEGTPTFFYNEALCKARNPIERLFGVMKGTWRCLSRQRSLLYDPGFAGRIVNACSVLHNIRLGDRENEINDLLEPLIEPQEDNIILPEILTSSTAKRIQDRIVTNYFT